MPDRSDLARQMRSLKYIIESTGGSVTDTPDALPKFEATNSEFVFFNTQVQQTIKKIQSNINRKQRLELRDAQHPELPHLTQTINQGFESVNDDLIKMNKILETMNGQSKKGKIEGFLNIDKADHMIEIQKNIITRHQNMIGQLKTEFEKVKKKDLVKGRDLVMQGRIGDSVINFDDLPKEEQEEELKILEDWRQRDSAMDGQLDVINELLLELKESVKEMDIEIEKRDEMVINTKGKVNTVHAELEQQNKQLEGVLSKMRGLGKVCVDAMLITLLLFLGRIVLKLAMSGKN